MYLSCTHPVDIPSFIIWEYLRDMMGMYTGYLRNILKPGHKQIRLSYPEKAIQKA